jgi:ABC-type Na+ efflux pump permease subunit
MIKALAIKDWQVFEKQMAGYILGMLLALSLIGTAKPWPFSAGALLLLVLLVSTGFYTIQTSLLVERKEQTAAFVMSLPISPADFFWSKLLGNLAIYLVPLGIVTGGTVFLVLFTPLPDGLLVYSLLIYGFMLVNFCVCLSFAIAVESEAWNAFVMMALMTMVGPFIYWIGTIPSIGPNIRKDSIVWSMQALSVFAGEFLVIAAVLALTSWVHSRKKSFL